MLMIESALEFTVESYWCSVAEINGCTGKIETRGQMLSTELWYAKLQQRAHDTNSQNI